MQRKGPKWWFLELFLVRRLLGSRGRGYVSLVSAISTWGLALGVASLVVIFSITSGFEDVFREKILGVFPHLVVIGKGGDVPNWPDVQKRLEGRPHLSSFLPATYDEMMASKKGRRSGAIVKGIDCTSKRMVEVVQPFLLEGRVESLYVEAEVSLDEDQLHISGFPGGSVYAVVIAPDGKVVRETFFDEVQPIPMVRVWSLSSRPTEVEVSGVLLPVQISLLPGDLSKPVEVPEGTFGLSVGKQQFQSPEQDGDQVAIIVDREEGAQEVFWCPLVPPGSGSQPAHFCFVNASLAPVTARLPSETIRLEPGALQFVADSKVDKPKVLLGYKLAEDIEAQVGDEVRLVSPLFSVQGISERRKAKRTIADSFVVAGIVRLGFFEYDSKLALLDFNAARRFLHQGDVARWIEVRVDDIFVSEKRGIELGRYLGGFSLLDVQEAVPALNDKFEYATGHLSAATSADQFIDNVNTALRTVKFSNVEGELALGYEDDWRVITWEEMNKPLFTSMKRQKIVLSLFFLIIIVVAAFNVVSSQVMIVKEKSSDIAILKAMGATNSQVQRVFQIQGMLIGVVGTGAGIALALAVCLALEKIGFPLDPEVYFVSRLPVKVSGWDLILSSVLSLAAIWTAVSVAARRAARKSPVEGLRELD